MRDDRKEPLVYLVGNWESGNAALQCEREECMVPGNCSAGMCYWIEDLPYHATWQDAADAVARHLIKHYEDAP